MRKQLFENTKDRDSVLGTYDIDKNGDTTLTDYGLYTIDDGELTFDKVIKAQAASQHRVDAEGRAGARPAPARAFGIDCKRLGSRISHQHLAAPTSDAVREFISSYGLIVVLLALPVYYGIQDLSDDGNLTRLGNNLVDGLSNGAIWALVALGYTLVYGIIELINFAHGEIFMIGSFIVVRRSAARSG